MLAHRAALHSLVVLVCGEKPSCYSYIAYSNVCRSLTLNADQLSNVTLCCCEQKLDCVIWQLGCNWLSGINAVIHSLTSAYMP